MRLVAALTDPDDAASAQEQGADIVELRFDLMDGEPAELVRRCRKRCSLPVIATFRSVGEGGRYAGSPDEWLGRIRPVLPLVEYVDIEQGFSCHAGEIKAAGKGVIASYHTGGMPDLYELFDLERHLRMFGDIVKIIVTPRDEEDVIGLLTFTHAVKRPICTGVLGGEFRYARALLPLFGSDLAYCSAGKPTASGQYTVGEFRQLLRLLGR